jgi:hypothetical protein
MRKLWLTTLASTLVLALAPAAALARGNHSRHHRKAARHSRIKHHRFGSDQSTSTGTGTAQDAGTVQSFDSTGKLTIVLNDGSAVTGQVTDATQIECQNAQADQTNGSDQHTGDAADRSGSGDNGDNGGGGGSSDNDDNGDDDANQGGAGATCSTSDLTPGALVREAELTISPGSGAVWNKVELDSQHA